MNDDLWREVALWLHPEDAMALICTCKQVAYTTQKLLPRLFKHNDRPRVGDRIWFTQYGHWTAFEATPGVVVDTRHKHTLVISDRWGKLYKRSARRVTRKRKFKVPVTFDCWQVRFGMVRMWCPVCRLHHFYHGPGLKAPKCFGGMGSCFEAGYRLV
jgi:hypothetical protein